MERSKIQLPSQPKMYTERDRTPNCVSTWMRPFSNHLDWRLLRKRILNSGRMTWYRHTRRTVYECSPETCSKIWCIFLTIFAVCSAISMNLLETGKDYIKVIFISTSMGLVFSKSLSYTISYYMSQDYIHTQFFLYVCIMSFFHYSEYVSVAVFNPNDLKMDAFMLTHSWEYGLALCTSLAEMGVESYFFPFLKGNIYFISLGLLMTSSLKLQELSNTYVQVIRQTCW